MQYKGMTALITGASSGLGEAFGTQLAAKGANVVPVARSEDTLNRLAETLRANTRVQVSVVPADLSSAELVESVIAGMKNRYLVIDTLINNAGLGVFENFLDMTFAKQVQQVDLNVREDWKQAVSNRGERHANILIGSEWEVA